MVTKRWKMTARAALGALALGLLLGGGAAAAQGDGRGLRPAPAGPIGWLGITIQDVGEELAERLAARFGPAAGTGVLVVEAMADGPAARAGLRQGDVIVGLDEQPIWDVRQLQRRVRATAAGRRVMVTLLREGDRLRIPVAVGAMPEEAVALVLGEALGFSVRPGPGEGARRAGGRPADDPSARALVVAWVDPRSPARAAGLQPMDVLLEVDGRPVADLKDLSRALRQALGKPSFPVTVARDGQRVPLTLAPAPNDEGQLPD